MSGTIPPGITVVGAGNTGDLDFRVTVLENIIPRIQVETSSLRNTITNLAAVLSAQIECCDNTNARLDEAITTLSDSLETLSDSLESLSLRIDTIEAGMNTLMTKVTALETFNARVFTIFDVIPDGPFTRPINRTAPYTLSVRQVQGAIQFYWRAGTSSN